MNWLWVDQERLRLSVLLQHAINDFDLRERHLSDAKTIVGCRTMTNRHPSLGVGGEMTESSSVVRDNSAERERI